MAPSEFWGMTLSEFWQLYDLKAAAEQRAQGKTPESVFDELYKRLH